MNNSETGSSKPNKKTKRTLDIVNQGLARRYRAERRFRYYGLSAILASLLFLSLLFISIFANGYSAFMQTFVRLNVFFDPEMLQQESLATANYQGLVKSSLRKMFPDVNGRRDKRQLYGLVSSGASFQLRDRVLKHPNEIGKSLEIWVPADDDVGVQLMVKKTLDFERTPSTDSEHYRTSTYCILNPDGRELKCETIRGHWPKLLARLATLKEPWTVCFEATCGYGFLYRQLSRMARGVSGRAVRLSRRCPVCDIRLNGDPKYCSECGSRV